MWPWAFRSEITARNLTKSGMLCRLVAAIFSGASMKKAGALVITALFGLGSNAALADDVPKLDYRKSCRVDVSAYPGGGGNKACLTDEQNARKTLVAQWKRFSPESRARCSRMATDLVGDQSYVELLTCLQMARDVKTLPKM
jgi:hypothetical protein